MDAVSRNAWLLGLTEGERWSGAAESRERRPDPRIRMLNHAEQSCADHLVGLARLIEAEVIPRLLLAHGASPSVAPVPPAAAWIPLPGAVREFTEIVLGREAAVAMRFVEGLQSQGATMESLCTELLGPTARRLGQLWESDDCDIAEVTLGLMRLHGILRDLAPPSGLQEAAGDGQAPRALLVPVPGEDHRLGIAMVVEFFRREGWSVQGEVADSIDELRTAVSDEWFDVVGLSASSTVRLTVLSASVRAVREASRNRRVVVLVGGQLFSRSPELGLLVNADAVIVDGLRAPAQAREILARRSSQAGG